MSWILSLIFGAEVQKLSGHCVNSADLQIYHQYPQELTGYSKTCALLGLVNLDWTQYCFENYVGFSPNCSECWTQNVECDLKYCRQICLTSILTGENNNLANGDLNTCLQCDETHCGEEFLSCAGANRRRLGIITDIARPSDQIHQTQIHQP